MFEIRVLCMKRGCNIFYPLYKSFSTSYYNEKSTIALNKVLVFSKFSRYDFERHTLSKHNDHEFETILRDRGTDYDRLIQHKILNKEFERTVIDALKVMKIETKIVNRLTCTKDLTDWADVIMPTGGDGTFLLAAGKVKDNKKPVIGFNSSPNNSEGYLCLPKKYSQNIVEVIQKLKKGEFKWLMRNRIRTTMLSKRNSDKPVDLQLTTHRIFDDTDNNSSILPILALNEVFASEQISAKTSHYSITLDNDNNTRTTKSSGVCIATGTGSTSWHYSMNRLPVESVSKLLDLLKLKCDTKTVAAELASNYNQNLIFKPDDPRMCYTIRDMIVGSVWPMPQGLEPCGYASSIRLKSHCFDAGLVIDGNVSFPFNDGAEAVFGMYPEDALRTVVLND